MPGKVNPVIPEAAAMVAAQVIGNDATITIAGQSGNFQLNVMLPVDRAESAAEHRAARERVVARSPMRRSRASRSTRAKLDDALERNPILVTALNPVIGYEKGAAIAKQAYKEGRADPRVAAAGNEAHARAATRAARSARAHEGRDQRLRRLDAIRRRLAAPRSPRDPRERLLGNVDGPVSPALREVLERPGRPASVLLALLDRPRGSRCCSRSAPRTSRTTRARSASRAAASRPARRRPTRRCARRTRRSACIRPTSRCSARSTSCSRAPVSRSRPSSARRRRRAFVATPDPTRGRAACSRCRSRSCSSPHGISVGYFRAARLALSHLRAAPWRLPDLGRDGRDPAAISGRDTR